MFMNKFLVALPHLKMTLSPSAEIVHASSVIKRTQTTFSCRRPEMFRAQLDADVARSWSQKVVTLFCPPRRKKRYGKHASRQRPHDSKNSSQASQRSKGKTSTLARRYGLSCTTVTKWHSRMTTTDVPMGPSQPKAECFHLPKRR